MLRSPTCLLCACVRCVCLCQCMVTPFQIPPPTFGTRATTLCRMPLSWPSRGGNSTKSTLEANAPPQARGEYDSKAHGLSACWGCSWTAVWSCVLAHRSTQSRSESKKGGRACCVLLPVCSVPAYVVCVSVSAWSPPSNDPHLHSAHGPPHCVGCR